MEHRKIEANSRNTDPNTNSPMSMNQVNSNTQAPVAPYSPPPVMSNNINQPGPNSGVNPVINKDGMNFDHYPGYMGGGPDPRSQVIKN